MKLIDILVEELPKRGGWPDDSDEMCQSQFDCEIYTNSKLMSDFYVDERAEDNCIDNDVTREQYEAALAAKSEGWIEWSGGECPVSDSTMVEVRYRNGEVRAASKADFYEWGHGGSHFVTTGFEIIAYRLHQTQEADKVRAAAWNAYAGIAEVSGDKADLNECASNDAEQVWNGEGLPPIGCFCEVEDLDGMLVYGQGESGEVIAHVENTSVIRMSYGLGCFEARFLRPLRTEAERKRDAYVEIMTQILCSPSQASATAKKIYDAIAAGKIPGVKLED